MMKETNMTTFTTHLGELRISDEGAYHPGKFTIEAYYYWNGWVQEWGMPAWDEMGYPGLHHHFDTVNDAFIALKADYLID